MLQLAATHDPKAVSFFGFNPGLISTDIRASTFGSGVLGRVASYLVEGVIGLMNPDPGTYAATMLQVLTAPGLEVHSGAMFGQKGAPILADAPFRDGGATARVWYEAMEKLVQDKAGL